MARQVANLPARHGSQNGAVFLGECCESATEKFPQFQLSPDRRLSALAHAGDFDPTLWPAQAGIYPAVSFKFKTHGQRAVRAHPSTFPPGPKSPPIWHHEPAAFETITA
jgi:hypothetical protein